MWNNLKKKLNKTPAKAKKKQIWTKIVAHMCFVNT